MICPRQRIRGKKSTRPDRRTNAPKHHIAHIECNAHSRLARATPAFSLSQARRCCRSTTAVQRGGPEGVAENDKQGGSPTNYHQHQHCLNHHKSPSHQRNMTFLLGTYIRETKRQERWKSKTKADQNDIERTTKQASGWIYFSSHFPSWLLSSWVLFRFVTSLLVLVRSLSLVWNRFLMFHLFSL